jgi:predicted dehydrogenase
MKAIKAFPHEVEAVGVLSRTALKSEAFAREHGIPVVARDMADMVQQSQPDALMILVSEDQMKKAVLEAMGFGLPLFIEKPAGLTPEDNLELAQAAEKHKIRTMVGFNRRYYSIFHQGIEIIRRHGQLRGVVVEGHERMWRVRAGCKFPEAVLEQWIYANSTHTIDLLRFFGGEPRNISAITHSRMEKKGDQMAAIMEFESGAIGNYSAHWYSPGGWRVVLYGDGVTVEFKPLESGRWTNEKFETVDITPDDIDVQVKAGFGGQIRAFVKLVSDNDRSWPLLDLRGAYETMLLAQKMCLKGGK